LKRITIILVAAIMAMAGAVQSSAQFRIGPKVGVAVNSLHFNRSTFDSENRAGFTGGLMMEFTVPLIGIGLDASALYVRRSGTAYYDGTQNVGFNGKMDVNRDYIAIPVNFKWKLKLPLVRPFLTTGPEFAFLTSRKAVSNAFRNKSVDYSWNFGAGVEILSHIQVAASYGIGINKALRDIGAAENAYDVSAHDRTWLITLAYLF